MNDNWSEHPMAAMKSHDITKQWLDEVKTANQANPKDEPNYWNNHPKALFNNSAIRRLTFGTGCSIYTNSILPAIAYAGSEVIIVTCYWARSATLDGLNKILARLSRKGTLFQRTIRVRIYFSSSSLFQKLFHTTSLQGRTWSAAEQQKKLGLPPPEELPGLDLQVKSIFVLPFSVMHPKFVMIDREQVFLPSCNVSWEDWFEGCVQLAGPIVAQFVQFWQHFWASEADQQSFDVGIGSHYPDIATKREDHPQLLYSNYLDLDGVSSIFLPSPHHRNPKFALPWTGFYPPPPTPLNTFLLSAFANAKKEIYTQTPNLTCQPVLHALLAALRRGVDVTILTSESLMIVEQLVTAGTTTQRCVRKLIKLHKRLIKQHRTGSLPLLEAGFSSHPGRLFVSYFRPKAQAAKDGSEPVQSHLKLTIIDGEIAVLGSGNMDRASWYTSQELGLAFFSAELALEVRTQLDALMVPRSRLLYDSSKNDQRSYGP